jgi:hypothetical protein
VRSELPAQEPPVDGRGRESGDLCRLPPRKGLRLPSARVGRSGKQLKRKNNVLERTSNVPRSGCAISFPVTGSHSLSLGRSQPTPPLEERGIEVFPPGHTSTRHLTGPLPCDEGRRGPTHLPVLRPVVLIHGPSSSRLLRPTTGPLAKGSDLHEDVRRSATCEILRGS